MKQTEIATPQQIAWAGRVWKLMLPHDRVGCYFQTTGYFDPKQERAFNDWYNLGWAERREIANFMLRCHSYYEAAR
jgi:hypothetical protein